MKNGKPQAAAFPAIWLAAAAAASGPALAQQDGASASAGDGLDEIIVSARKRDENLQDVPFSITAFTAESIEQRGIESVYDLAKLTPNLSFNQAYGRVFDRPVIRGMSQILGDRTVSFVVDGIYIAGNMSADLDDLEQVEVLKGPQAANFGRGSLAGVISYRTRRPTDEWRGNATVTGGENGWAEATANISGPIIGETLTFKLGARYYDYDGQYTARSTDGSEVQLGSENTKRVSGALLWRPSDAVDVMVSAFVGQNSDGLYNNTIFKGLNCFTSVPFALSRGGSWCGRIPVLPKDGAIRVDFADIARQGQPGVQQDTNLYSAEANWRFSGMKLTGLISWNRQDEDWIVDDYLVNDPTFSNASQVPGPTMTIANPGNITRLVNIREYRSQELRLASDGEGALSWLVGLYHYDSQFQGLNGGPRYNINLANGMAAPTNTGPVGTLREVSQVVSPSTVDNEAVFASVGYDLTDRWHLSLEGRYQRDVLETNNSVQIGSNCAPRLSAEYTSFTPRGSIRFEVTPDVNVYATASLGNKPGDFNTSLCSALVTASEFARLSDIAPLDVKEEEALNYEIGSKMRFFDGRMSLDVAAFYIDWSDQQVTSSQAYINNAMQPANISLTLNAGKTEIKGIELNWRWRLSDHWDVSASYGWTDAEFEENCDAVYAGTLGVTVQTPPCAGFSNTPTLSVAGFQTANSPEHTGNVGLEFKTPVGDRWTFFARSDASYQGTRYAEQYNFTETGDATRFDARLGLQGDEWTFTFWGRNVGNERSADSVVRFFDPDSRSPIGVPTFQRAYQVHYPDGRQFGLTAAFRF
jgi:outer membrane receptor protein involved in Fe transport